MCIIQFRYQIIRIRLIIIVKNYYQRQNLMKLEGSQATILIYLYIYMFEFDSNYTYNENINKVFFYHQDITQRDS